MKITDKKLKNNTIQLSIHVKENDYVSVVETTLLGHRKKMNLPGFRVGKVPMSLVRKKYELAIRVEEINKLLSQAIQKWITDKKISILGHPLPIENEIDFVNNTEYIFEFELGLQPKIDISKVEKSKIDFFVIKADKTQVEEHVATLQKRYGTVKSFDKIKDGDMLNIFLQELNEKNEPKELGVTSTTSVLLDKIEDKIIKNKILKLSKKGVLKIELKKAFPNITDLASMLKITKEETENLNPHFLCEIKDITRLLPATLNLDFFKKCYPSENIKTIKEFKKVIKNELETQYIIESDRKLFNDASNLFMKKIKINFPDDFLKKWLKTNIKKEFTEAEFETEYLNYLKYLSWQLIENTICLENNIKITNEKLEEFTKDYVLRQMKAYGNINMGNKEIEGVVHNILKNKKESEKMMNEVILIELVEYFKSKMKLIKKSVSLNEFIKLANNQK